MAGYSNILMPGIQKSLQHNTLVLKFLLLLFCYIFYVVFLLNGLIIFLHYIKEMK